MTPCPVCGGTMQIKIPNATGGETVEKCPVCLGGKVGLYKASEH